MWKIKAMEWGARLTPVMRKYRYALIVLLAGLILLYVGAPRDAPKEAARAETGQAAAFDLAAFQTDLQTKLSHIEGAGQVELLLSMEDTEEIIYASNIRQTSAGERSESYENSLTVLSDGSYGEQPVRVKSVCPTFRGAVILCEGGDRMDVKLAVTEAVSTACGIGMDKISVLKMMTK